MNVAVQGLSGLGEQEQDSRSSWGCDLPSCFVGALGSDQPVAVFVITRFSIDKDYVAMGVITLDIIQGRLPGSARRIITQGNLAPPTERASDFDCRWFRCLIGRNRPTEHFAEPEPLVASFSTRWGRILGRSSWSCLGPWRPPVRFGLPFNVTVKAINHIATLSLQPLCQVQTDALNWLQHCSLGLFGDWFTLGGNLESSKN